MSPELEKFVDRLPIMQVARPTFRTLAGPYYEIKMEEVTKKLHRDLPATTVWGYNDQFPGPTFDVQRGEPIYVKWLNRLPAKHLLLVDISILDGDNEPEVRTVTHWGRTAKRKCTKAICWCTLRTKNIAKVHQGHLLVHFEDEKHSESAPRLPLGAFRG
ncbi:multicopper oxidase domain-containing protein [Camelliibacillus cellulosilyticus]|uniref:Multicopper oxidase domain-containing protein n=1 Tax=Camelliibacillus cellulosilyticus TaxID=2174486 RepID=A0ABV9GMS2_9BACL